MLIRTYKEEKAKGSWRCDAKEKYDDYDGDISS